MQDLSSLAKGWPAYGASMAAGNTVTEGHPSNGLPGSPSEQTADVSSHDTPELTIPAQTGNGTDSPARTSSRFSTSYAPAAAAWKTVK